MTEQVLLNYDNEKSTIRGLSETDHIFKIHKNYNFFYELKLLEKIKSFNLNGTYVDVGSNIGNHTLFFSKHCGSEKVISIELNNSIFEVLKTNIQENDLDNVETLNIGVGEKHKFVEISDINLSNVGMTKIIGENGGNEIQTLDFLLKDEKNITLIKIDVEGYEKNVILGAKNILKKHSPIVITEIETEDLFKQMELIMNKLGYETDKVTYAKTPTYIWIKKTKIFDFVYLVPSYGRFDKAKRLVDQINQTNTNHLIIFLNDGSKDEKYEVLKNYDHLIYLENEINNGKYGYWKTVNKLFKELSNYQFKHAFMMNDDFILIDNFVDIINKHKNKNDIIRLFTPITILGKNWEYDYWIDGAFCAPYIFFEKLNFELFPINPKKNQVSSGVGIQMTKRLNNLKFKVLNFGSLVYHDGNEDSVMHPSFRGKNHLVGMMYEEKKYLISIIVPTYKNIYFLKECLDSIVKSSENLYVEILVGIDHCKETVEFIKNETFDEKIKFFFFEENVGPYIIKNSLSKISNSDNIFFFDSDDVAYPELINNIIDYLKNFDLVKPMYHDFSGDLNKNDPIYKTKSKNWGEGVFAIKKEIFLNYNGFEGWKCAADSDFMGRMYKNNIKVKLTERPLIYRRIHPDSLTKKSETGYHSNLRKEYYKISKNKTYFGPLSELKISQFSEVGNYKYEQIVECKTEIVQETQQNVKTQQEIILDLLNKPKVVVNTSKSKINEKREMINNFNRFIPQKKRK